MIVLLRLLCVFWWIGLLLKGVGAVEGRDWHLVVAQIAQALIALVLWFSVESDSERLRAPRFGTRWLRLALYMVTLLVSLVAFLPWQWPLGDVVTLRDATVMVFAVMIVGPYFNAEWRREVTP
jgi:hypothetical protein